MRRRQFLGGTLTVLVAGGQVWRAFGQTSPEVPDGPAFELWRTWRADMQEGPLALVHAAILSANAFNSQPWLFKVTPSKIDIYADTKRNLGAFDPYLREMHFSIGCALENLVLAAQANRFRTEVAIAPGQLSPAESEPKAERVVTIDLADSASAHRSELFEAIPRRHTNRTLFDSTRELPAALVRDLANLVDEDDKDVKLFLFQSPDQRKIITDLIWDSSRRFTADPDVRRGTQPWLHATMDQLQSSGDGAYVGDPSPGSYVDLMSSGRLFGLIAVRDRYERAQTIRAGRVWQRAHLLATARGIAARPANGAVEIIDHERRLNMAPQTTDKLAAITDDASWQPTFMFYMGYSTMAAPASVRRPLARVVID